MSYFPMFVELKNKACLIVGGGQVAYRKVAVLLDFGAKVSVIAPKICDMIKEVQGITCLERAFTVSDLDTMELVVAATDDKQVNHEISCLCRARQIPINAVDQIEDCSFIFPSYIKTGEVVGAFSSGGSSPVITQYLKEEIRPAMTEHLGRIAALLGSLREEVKQCVDTEAKRKKVYQKILLTALETGELPSETAIERIIEEERS